MGSPYFPWILLLAFFLVVVMEMFLPSAGILFVLSVVLAISAVVLGFFQSMTVGVIILTIVVLSIPVLISMFVLVWPHTPLGKRFTIAAPKPESILPKSMTQNPLMQLKGKRGTVTVPMLPTGEMEIDGKRYSATCQSGSAEIGEEMRVVQIRMGRLLVLPVEIADDHMADGGFEESLDQSVEKTSFEDFEWDDDAS